MKTIKPAALKKGDLIGVVCPASPPSSVEKISRGVEYLERLGYRVTLGKNIDKVYGYLAGTNEERADDLNGMFADKNVKAIIAVRGGYGTPRILPFIDYSLIKKNPKILVGYSDLTALQLAIFQKTGLITFSGPMVGVEMFKGIDPFTEEHFWKTVTSTKKIGPIRLPAGRVFTSIRKGKSSGRLLGGNLSLITSILGSSYSPSYSGALLFLEEIEEELYRFDRMMTQLKIARIFDLSNGVLIGELTDVKASDTSKPNLTLEQILADTFAGIKKPVMTGLVYGHVPKKLTIPVGAEAVMDAGKGTVTIIEPAAA
ncbi:MAG: LD-carboxypeptidase [Bacteroidota bacterium]